MAVRDVRDYYYNLLNQYIEMKEDLADFEQAFKEGYITEDKLGEVKNQVSIIQTNFERIGYIIFLLEAPNRPSKKPRYDKANKKLKEHFEESNADLKSVTDENKSALDGLRAELKKLKNKQ